MPIHYWLSSSHTLKKRGRVSIYGVRINSSAAQSFLHPGLHSDERRCPEKDAVPGYCEATKALSTGMLQNPTLQRQLGTDSSRVFVRLASVIHMEDMRGDGALRRICSWLA